MNQAIGKFNQARHRWRRSWDLIHCPGAMGPTAATYAAQHGRNEGQAHGRRRWSNLSGGCRVTYQSMGSITNGAINCNEAFPSWSGREGKCWSLTGILHKEDKMIYSVINFMWQIMLYEHFVIVLSLTKIQKKAATSLPYYLWQWVGIVTRNKSQPLSLRRQWPQAPVMRPLAQLTPGVRSIFFGSETISLEATATSKYK